MMDYIAGLVQRGLISPDVAQGLVQQIANWKPPGPQPPVTEGGGAGTRLGATTTREPLLGNADPAAEMRARNREYYKNYGDLIKRPAEATSEIPIEEGPTGKPAARVQKELERQDRRMKNLKLEQ